MTKHKVSITIHGYGEIKVKIPDSVDKNVAAEIAAQTVVKTMNLIDNRDKSASFHPVLGFGGHIEDNRKIRNKSDQNS